MAKRRLLGVLFSLVMVLGMLPEMGITASAEDATVTWSRSDITQGESFSNNDVTVQTNIAVDMTGSPSFSGEGTFSTTKGNFTNISVSCGSTTTVSGNGWTLQSENTQATWTGEAASSVAFTGDIKDITSITFTIAPVDVSGVTIKQSTTLAVGETETLAATVAPDNATDKTVTWSTSDENIATVNNGVVTAVAAGEAIITATATNGTEDTSDDKTSECKVKVKPKVSGISLNKESTIIITGKSETLKATVTPEGAKDKTVTWSTSDGTIATVNNGVVTAVAAGEAIITATATNGTDNTADDVSATCRVVVHDPIPYLDWDGEKLVKRTGDDACKNYTVVTENTTNWTTGWYVVNSTVTINGTVTVSGTVHLILCDGASLNVITSMDRDNNAISVNQDGSSLTIYAQSKGTSMGALTVEGYNGIIDQTLSRTNLTINGGNITATGGLAGIGFGQPTVINSGNVTVSGDNNSIFARVKNLVPGIGWSDKQGTQGETNIGINPNGRVVTYYKKLQFRMTDIETEVSLDKTELQSIIVGGKVAFTAAVTPSDAPDKKVKWSVGGINMNAVTLYSDAGCETLVSTEATDVLTVYAKGMEAGSATVIVTSNADNTRTATCDVEVNTAPVPVTDVTLDKSAESLNVGSVKTLTAAVAPLNATNKKVTWHVDGTGGNSVKLYTDAKCTTEVGSAETDALIVYAKGESAGEATVIVTSAEDSSKSASCVITVAEPLPDSVTVLLEMGSGNDALANNVLDTYIAKYPEYASTATAEGSLLRLPVHTKDKQGAVLSVGRIQSELSDIVFDGLKKTYSIAYLINIYFNVGQHEIDYYSTPGEVYQEIAESKENVKDGIQFYAVLAHILDKIEINAEAPVCGSVVDPTQSDCLKPAVKVVTDHVSIFKNTSGDDTQWIKSDKTGPFSGKITGGNSYIAGMTMDFDFGYYISQTTEFLVNGQTADKSLPTLYSPYIRVFGNVTAEHDWGNWAATKEPTVTEKGEETRGCKGCDETESREIDKVTYSIVKGNGLTWIKGSTGTADFEFKRSYENKDTSHTAFDLFTEVQIDGKAVTDFTKEQGSVITKINASYMNTLSVGGHTVTAKFSDGGTVTSDFTVKDKPVKPTDHVVTCQMAGFPENYAWNEAAKACQPGYIDANGVFRSTARTSVPNTYDKGVAGDMTALLTSMLTAMLSAILLRRHV